MGYDNKKGNMTTEKFENKEKVSDVLKYPFVDAKNRNIRKDVLEKFGVRAALSPKDGKTVEAYYFPSYNQKGKIVGFTKQDITKDKSEKFHWSTIGSVVIGNKMFGQEVAEEVPRKKNNIILTEGQWDCLSVYQSMVDSVKGSKYAGMEPFVASIPMGTANAVESVLHNENFVKAFDSMTCFFDDDYATPAEAKKGITKGHEAREAVFSALTGSGITFFTVPGKEGFKDASDYMQAGLSSELAKLVQFEKRAYSAEKIVKASDISLEDLMAKRPEGIYVDEFPKLMQKIHGFRTRELVLLTAPSGVGKSTVTSIFAKHFNAAGERVGMIYLEETNVETMQRLMAARLRVNYLKFKDDPLSVATQENITKAYNDIINDDKLIMLSHFGSLPISELMNKIKTMHLVEGCRYIILDHLSMVISGSAIDNERKELDIVMTELAAFCAANDVCVIAVSHINRSIAADFKPPKGEEDKPFWVKVPMESMRGSASLEQLSWTIIGLEPQIMPDRNRGNVRLVVLKNRTWNSKGVADEFKLDEDTWSVILENSDAY